jgi:hypothetical protein|nr:MAG TPA: hypothetical protein [Caudoviricetes sp.]
MSELNEEKIKFVVEFINVKDIKLNKLFDYFVKHKIKFNVIKSNADYIKDENLQQEDEQLQLQLDKAIKYIEHEWFKREQVGIVNMGFSKWELLDLLEILKGDISE